MRLLRWRYFALIGLISLPLAEMSAFAQTPPSAQPEAPAIAPAEPAETPPGANGDNAAPPSAAPSPIKLKGEIAGQTIAAELTRTGESSWEWVENNARFQFRTLLDTASELVIYDRSRDMFHRLNFETGESAWRVGDSENWTPHYTIVQNE